MYFYHLQYTVLKPAHFLKVPVITHIRWGRELSSFCASSYSINRKVSLFMTIDINVGPISDSAINSMILLNLPELKYHAC